MLMYHQDRSIAGPKAPQHLNNTGCYIKYIAGKGRGVFGRFICGVRFLLSSLFKSVACRDLPRNHLLEISPVLLFSADEYASHGRHKVLDHYTFVWRDGRMALALGLGTSTLSDSVDIYSQLINCINRVSIQSLAVSERVVYVGPRDRVYSLHHITANT